VATVGGLFPVDDKNLAGLGEHVPAIEKRLDTGFLSSSPAEFWRNSPLAERLPILFLGEADFDVAKTAIGVEVGIEGGMLPLLFPLDFLDFLVQILVRPGR